MPDVTPKPLRSGPMANLMGAVGGIISLLLMSALIPDTGKPNYLPIFAIVAGLMVTAVVILVLTIKENKLREEIEKLQGHEDDESERLSEHQPLPYAVQRSLLFILLSIFFWFMAYNAVTTAFSKYAQEVLGMGILLMLSHNSCSCYIIPSG